MATISKLKSGSYQIRKMMDGVRYSFTIDHKPTKAEAEKMMVRYIRDHEEKKDTGPDISFASAASTFIELSDGVLSASTIREYVRMARYIERAYRRFWGLSVGAITSTEVQRVISDYAKGKDPASRSAASHRSAKSVSNLYGFIRSVLRTASPDLQLRVTLPEAQKQEIYIPTDADVRAVAQALKGTRYEASVILASLGLRRGEVLGLQLQDVHEDTVYIHQVKVQDRNGKWIIKDTAKTAASTRVVEIPRYLSELIHRQGYVYKGAPGQITIRLHQIQDKLGIPRFSVHKLRHFYASSAVALVPLSYVQRAGGWEPGSAALQRIYIHAQKDKQKEMDRIAMEHIASVTGVANE